MSWSRNCPNCMTMWVNSLLPGFESLSPGIHDDDDDDHDDHDDHEDHDDHKDQEDHDDHDNDHDDHAGFELLSPGVLCMALDTSRGPTFTWARDVSFAKKLCAQLDSSRYEIRFPKLCQPCVASANLLALPRNQDPPVSSSQWQSLPNSHSSSCCTSRQFFELCRIFRSQLSHPCKLHLRLLLTERKRHQLVVM